MVSTDQIGLGARVGLLGIPQCPHSPCISSHTSEAVWAQDVLTQAFQWHGGRARAPEAADGQARAAAD